MDARSPHPNDEALGAYGLGKLDNGAAEEVDRHLEQCPDCRARVAVMSADTFPERVREAGKRAGGSTSAPPTATRAPTATGPSAAAPQPANTPPPGLADHPDYEIRRELGRGGMGVVYLAHNRLMGRDEVLKVMGRHIMERPGILDRFLREIRAVARLRHPNIVTAYHATRFGESLVFAMEYVEGLDLARMVKAKGPLPVGHACHFVYQAALGLQHAHEEGLVHRDIKPGNLMLARKGDRPVVKVLDFGLAKATREEKVDGALTSEGQALGTPDYIAPEQILDAQKADIRADIYSLGGTLYYLLTGQAPFRGSSLYDLFQAHISRDVGPLDLLRPEVPAELAALVAKMMAKDPARRFQTPGEVAATLTPFFRTAGATAKVPRPGVSRGGQPRAGRPVAGGVSEPTPAATDDRSVPVRSKAAPGMSDSEPRWETLLDLQVKDPSTPPDPVPASKGRLTWLWSSVAAGVFLFALLAAWLTGVLSKPTPDRNRSPKTAVVPPEGTRRSRAAGGSAGSPAGGVAAKPARDSRERFVPLFNGRDLTGWKPSPSEPNHWRVENGVLVGSGREKSILYSERGDYKDFHLRVEARISEGGNSGVFFRVPFGAGWASDFEAQIGTNDTGQLLGYGQQVGSRVPAPPIPSDAWFTFEVIAEGTRVVTRLDGKVVTKFADAGHPSSPGHIALEVVPVSARPTVVEFRKIEIKER
jgi:serine/threonine protein kinase